MANSVKLLNYVDPDGEFIKFYTELNSNFQVGDRVFIVGGNYDNTKLAETDPYNEYAAGYTIVAADLTNISNSITLNVRYNDSRFSNNPTSTLFEPYTVYIDRIETFKNINQNAEAFITKNRFTRGEFNGGRFLDGIFGEYKRYDDEKANEYTTTLLSSNIDHDELEDVQTFFYNYNLEERAIPIEEFKAYYNRKEENEPAIFSNGVFFGGNWQWGIWNTAFPNNQTGKQQQLNSLGGIRNPLDESKYNVTEFSNNFNGLGYNIATSGNFGRIWQGELMLYFNDIDNQIILNFVPFELRRALRNAFNVKLDVQIYDTSSAYRNSKNFTIDFDPTPNSTDFTLLDSGILKIYEKIYADPNYGTDAFRTAYIQIEIADPDQILLSDPLKRKLSVIAPTRRNKHNSILTGRIQDADFFNGIWLSGQFQGGEWWNGEFKAGRIGSELRRTTWHDGYFNGTSNTAFANDVFWKNGEWQDGAWEGARNFKISSLIKLPIVAGGRNTNVQLDIRWENMFKVGDTVLLSYFKRSNSTLYLDNWSNDYTRNLLEFQTFTVLAIIHDYTNHRLLLTIDLNLDDISNITLTTNIFSENVVDINYQFARLSNSYFQNGIWHNGSWQNGYFNGNLKTLSIDSFNQNSLTIKVDDVMGLENGQYLEISNLRIVYVFDYVTVLGGTLGTAAGGVEVDDRPLKEYWLNVDQSLQILDLDLSNNLIILDISTIMENIVESTTITNITAYYPNNEDKRPGLLGYTTQIWENGIFNTGVWENGIWKDGVFRNIFVEDPTNTQNKSIWRSGVWLNGNWDNGVFLSGVWEAGVWLNGIMTNGWKRSTLFWNETGSWMQGDSIWYDGEWLNGQWLRGVWKKGIFENGTIENAGIDEIEIRNGKYLNGKVDINGNPIYSGELNTSNALNSAPSLIFIDEEGWVQLDQSSWYQIDYNVIIKDLYMRNNPFNDQMFNVLNRTTTASQIQISTFGGSGTQGSDIPQEFIDNSLPIVVIRNIVDIVETDVNVFWFADQAYKRIIEVDNTTSVKKFKVIGRIINAVDENVDLVFGNILKINSDNALDQNNLARTRWVYVLENTRIVRIHKDTNELELVVNFSTLQNDLTINLQEWIDIFVYPVRLGIPETLFILSRVQTSINNVFVNQYVIIALNLDTKIYNVLNFSGNNVTDADIPQEWLTGLTNNSLTLSSLKIKGFSLGEALNIFYKLPVTVVGANYTYQSNNVQRQRLSFVNNNWTISEYATNIISNANLTLDGNPYIFNDFAVRVLSPDFRYFLLSSDNQNIYYTLSTGGLVPLVTDVDVNKIDFGIQQILAIRSEFGANMSPVIIPQVTRRFGALDTHSKIKIFESVNALPLSSSSVVMWYIDQPSKRLLRLFESKAPELYDIADEFGIENAQMQKITFIANTENFNRIIMVEEQIDLTKKIVIFNKISATIDRTVDSYYLVGVPDITQTGLADSATIIDIHYKSTYIFNLYSKGTFYYYDYYRVDKQLSNNSFENPVLISNPIKIAHADEIFSGTVNSFNNKVVYIANVNTIVNNFGVVIFSAPNGEAIVDFGFSAISNNRRYMFVSTVNNLGVYRIYHVTKKFLTYADTPSWPGNNNGNGPSTIDIVYQSLTPVEDIYSNIGSLNRMVVNLSNAVDLLSLEHTSKAIGNVEEFIFTSETDYWLADNTTNRVLKYHNYGTSGNVQDYDFGQYKQPFETGKYLRNATSLRYLEWNSNKFLIFLDTDFSTSKKKIRAINLNANQSSTSETVVIDDLINGINQLTSIQDLFGDYLFPFEFILDGTAGTSGTYLPPGLTGLENYEFLDLWTKNISNTGVLKVLIRDNVLSIYFILTLTHTTAGNTSYNLENVSASTAGFDFEYFTATDTNVYLSNQEAIYSYDAPNVVSLINILPAPIQNFFVSEGTAGAAPSLYAVVNNFNGLRKLFRIDHNGVTFEDPISDDNATLFNNIDFAEVDYDLDKIIIKSGLIVNRLQTSSINDIINNILKIAKYNVSIFAHTTDTLYRLNITTLNYVELEIPAYANIKKLVAFSENVCYAIYENNLIYSFDFTTLTSTQLIPVAPEYSENGYHYIAVDIAKVTNKLAILYRILNDTYSTAGQSYLNSYCDVWVYDTEMGGTDGFSKIDYTYTVDTLNDPLDPVLYVAGTNAFALSGTAGLGNNSTVTPYVGNLTNTPIEPFSVEFTYDVVLSSIAEILQNGTDSTGPYIGILANTQIVPATLFISAGTSGEVINDDGLGILFGGTNGVGTIDYNTGLYNFTTSNIISSGETFLASYDFNKDGSIVDNGTSGLVGDGIGSIDYNTGVYSFTTVDAIPNTNLILSSYSYTVLDYQYDDGKPYSVKGKLLAGNCSTNLWVYHNDDTGLVWKVLPGDFTLLFSANAVEFDMSEDDNWAILDNSNIVIINNLQIEEETYTTITIDNNSVFFNIVDLSYYYILNNLSINNTVTFIPKQTFNWSVDKTITVSVGTEIYDQVIYPLTTLGAYETDFNGQAFFNSYSAFNDLSQTATGTNTLISPHVSGRVLYNTIWKNGQFNVGVNNQNSAYTAHLVSSKWLAGRFRGSWDTPRYLDHYALRQESIFLGGVFGDAITGDANSNLTAIWNDGLFLGGDWKTGQFLNGHFFSEKAILVENISFPNIVINQIQNVRWDYAKQQLRVDVDHFKWNPTIQSYESTSSQLAKYNLVQIPGLFKDIKINILEIRKNKYPISGYNEIILICELPLFDYPTDWLENTYIYIAGLTTHIEYLYGEHFVTDTFTYENNFWITIRSDFDQFNSAGIYTIGTKKPYISFNLLRIQEIVFNNSLTSSIMWFNVPISLDTEINQVNFIKSALLSESVDIINDVFYDSGTSNIVTYAADFGKIVLDETFQMYSRSVNGVNATITLNNVTALNTILLNNVTAVNYIGTSNIYDITVYNSAVNSTLNTTSIQFYILNSLIMSGTTNIPLKDSGWLNRDDKGFPYAKSTFNAIAFNGNWDRIINVQIDAIDSNILEIELVKPLKDLNVNQYVYLRGFSGNKANVIGSAVSRAFRVLRINQNKFYIKNPFTYYNAANIIEDKEYRFKFDGNELLQYKQTMNLRRDLRFDFNYAYASTNAWNGGTFIGRSNTTSNFNGVWNAGKFSPANISSNFNGEWFATPFNYYWAGNIAIIVTQVGNAFKLELNLTTVGLNWEDGNLVRVDFINDSPSGFYATILNSRVSNTYSTFFNAGLYNVNIVRLKNDYLILDRNLEIGPETDKAYHQIFNKNIYNWSAGNAALFFNGSTDFNITYVAQAINAVDNAFVFDFWFNATTVNNLNGEPLISFRMTSADFTVFVNYDGLDYNLIVQYSLNSTSYIKISKIIDTNWHHIYFNVLNGEMFVYFDTVDQINVNAAGVVGVQVGAWTITSLNYTSGFFINRNTIREITLGRYKHTDTSQYIATAGAIDQLRFWNQMLTISQIDEIYNAKILSKHFPQIATQIAFDDPENEYLNINDSKLRISNVEYVSNVTLRDIASTESLLYLNFEIEELESWMPLVKFSTNQIQNLLLEKAYQFIVVNVGSTINYYLEQEKSFDTITYAYTGVLASFPLITDFTNQFFYTTTSLNEHIFTYEAETNLGSGIESDHAIALTSINNASWNTLPRIIVRFKNDGLSSTVSIHSSLDSSPISLIASFNIGTLTPAQQILPAFAKYSIRTSIDLLNNITISIVLGNNQYGVEVFSTTFANPLPTTVHIANVYGAFNTRFKNRRVETFKYLSTGEFGNKTEIYITNKKWIFNRSSIFTDTIDLQTTEIFNMNSPILFHFGDETISNILSQSLIKYNEINVFSNTNVLTEELTLLNNLISGDNTNITVLRYINQENYANFSNYYIIYPNVSNYGVLVSAGTAGTSGNDFIISGYGTPETVTTFKYYLGDALNRLRESDQYGTNLQIHPGGGPISEPSYYISETFALKSDGTPRWNQENVTFTSTFNNGNYKSKLWRAGIFNNGLINIANFVWKWGTATGGSIIDAGY